MSAVRNFLGVQFPVHIDLPEEVKRHWKINFHDYSLGPRTLGYWRHVWRAIMCYSESASDSGREQPATKTGYATRTQERPGARSVSLIRSMFVV